MGTPTRENSGGSVRRDGAAMPLVVAVPTIPESLRNVVGPVAHCPQCGYTLQGLPAHHCCPECAFEYDESMLELAPGRGPAIRRFDLLTGLFGLVALSAFVAKITKGQFRSAACIFAMLVAIGSTWHLRRTGSRHLLPSGFVCSAGRRRREFSWADVCGIQVRVGAFGAAEVCVRTENLGKLIVDEHRVAIRCDRSAAPELEGFLRDYWQAFRTIPSGQLVSDDTDGNTIS